MPRLAVLFFAVAAVAAAGQDRPLVFQVGSELVVLDLIATDDSGREVSDLTRSEIQIVEDGSPRPVQRSPAASSCTTVECDLARRRPSVRSPQRPGPAPERSA
jgi:hypothetical protein